MDRFIKIMNIIKCIIKKKFEHAVQAFLFALINAFNKSTLIVR